jgi:hypothetical protein
MVALKAFVGHSFTPDDEDIVRAFQKFFTELKATNPDFSWVSAEAAQPKELANKVLELMQDKNLFIGICTKKEAVVHPKELKPTKCGKHLMARKESFEPKTSDWIIQEIGLAIGKGMELILLIETAISRWFARRQGIHTFRPRISRKIISESDAND